MLLQIRSSDQWAFYQAKGIKANLLEMRIDMFTALGKTVSNKDQDNLARYRREQKEIFAEADSLQHESQLQLVKHRRYSYGVTMFQVGIAISAISVLTKKKAFWQGAMVFGLIGLVLLVYGLAAF